MNASLRLVVLAGFAAASTIARAQPSPTPPSPASPTDDATLSPTTAVAADTTTDQAAKQRAQGKALVTAAHYDQAIAQFQASFAIVPVPELQFEIADAYRAKGDAANAMRAYNAYLALESQGELADRARVRLTELTQPHAEATKPEYPLAMTDRPILLFAGMTEIDFSFDFPTYTTTTVDAMGNTTTDRTRLGDNVIRDLNVRHSFGAVQVSGGILLASGFNSFHAGATIGTGNSPGAVSLTASYYSDAKTRYSFTERANFAYRTLFQPGRFALYVGAGASASELSVTSATGMASSAHTIALSANAAAVVQLTRRLAFGVYPNLDTPVTNSSSTKATTVIGAVAQLLFAFRRWEPYAQFALRDLSGTRRPYAAFGFVVRL